MTSFKSQVSWKLIYEEAKQLAASELLFAKSMDRLVLKHEYFYQALSSILAFDLQGMLSSDELFDLFVEAHRKQPSKGIINYTQENLSLMKSISDIALYDLAAVRDRDPATNNLLNPLLHFKGYKAIQAYRIAHQLWSEGRIDLALHIQSRCSAIYQVDIHPAATIGAGFLIDHGTGIVVGETAVIGLHCSFLHGVTLGSTGKGGGDRHPKIGNSVLIGCNATILGNITIENCVKIGSGSIVLKSLPSNATVVGNPARIIGYSSSPCSASSMDVGLKDVTTQHGEHFQDTWSISIDGSTAFEEVDTKHAGRLTAEEVIAALTLRLGRRPSGKLLEEVLEEFNSATNDISNNNNDDQQVKQQQQQQQQQQQLSPRSIDKSQFEQIFAKFYERNTLSAVIANLKHSDWVASLIGANI